MAKAEDLQQLLKTFSESHHVLKENRASDDLVLWDEVSESRVDKVGIQQLAMYLGRLHKDPLPQGSPQITGDSEQVKARLHNEIFVQPYTINTESPSKQQIAASKLLEIPSAKSALDKLSDVLKTKQESFIHGDLSICNVTVNKGAPKFINLDECMAGPRSLDLARLLASYMAQYYKHELTPENNDAHRLVCNKMMDACTTTVSTYLAEMKSVLSDSDVQTLISETAGFIALELIKRSVGSAPYPGLENNPHTAEAMYKSAIRLLPKYESITDMGRLMMIGLALC